MNLSKLFSLRVLALAALVLVPTACEKASEQTNQKTEGSVVETESGLIYEVLTEGSGATPTTDDLVVVHYEGKLEDGTVFDSSIERGKPETFPVGRLIKGWTEALTMMKEGDKWKLTIPPHIGYGAAGAGGGLIPPNATLTFEMELLRITSIDEYIADMKKPQENFLTENAKKDDVIVTDSGLQYTVVRDANGAKPKSIKSTVTVHYQGRLIDGEEFDSSYKRGRPSSFALDRVIAGWGEGLQHMTIGSKYTFFIPADLGYGERGTPSGSVPPFATLIFDVELLEIED